MYISRMACLGSDTTKGTGTHLTDAPHQWIIYGLMSHTYGSYTIAF